MFFFYLVSKEQHKNDYKNIIICMNLKTNINVEPYVHWIEVIFCVKCVGNLKLCIFCTLGVIIYNLLSFCMLQTL